MISVNINMKYKLLISFIILFMVVPFLCFNVDGASIWKYIWDNTTITIPVGESFDKYMNMPVANLYRDGMLLTDANITYNTEGDWLYYSKNVNTTKCGTYQVWYKAFESKYIPGTCMGYKALVTFYVKDLEAPKLEILNSEIDVKRGREYNFNNNIAASDNYSKNLDIDFSGNVDFNKVGSYKVNVRVTDDDMNVSTGSFMINVYDDSIPTIECLKEGGDIYIPLDEEYNIKEYFKAYDLFDGDISDKIEYPSINNKVVSDYDYEVSVTNSNGKKVSYMAKIHVIDNKEPEIILTEESVILDYKIDFSNYNFKTYIDKIIDNQNINYDNLRITNNLINKVGDYKVWYEYSDGFYKVNKVLNVSLISHENPKMVIDDVVIDVDSSPDLYKYVSLQDESDENIYDTLVIDDSDVIYEKEGIYYANAYCINSSGLSTEKRMKVVINGHDAFSVANKGYSVTSIVLAFMVVGLIVFNVVYILITRNNKSNKKKDSNDNFNI